MKECPTCRLCFADNDDHCPNDGARLTFVFAGSTILEERYQLEQCIGRGGMGIVYRGRHILLKTPHAIKVILPELVGGDPGLVRRFRQEAMVAASIRHKNIVTVTDFGVVAEKMPFIVMDFIKGELLHDLLEREGNLPADRVFEIISAIGAGVGTAHQQGIIHRDLKPLNVMLQENLPLAEGIKILDFGLAKIKSGDVFGSFVMAHTTGLMGSPYYMAPEQWSEEEPDSRADIYSMGIMLYQMLAGEVPFRGPSVPVIMKKHIFDAPPTFESLGTHVPPEVDAVVRKCLEKDPAKRPQTVEELIRNLKEALMRSEGAATYVADGPTPPARPRRAGRAKTLKDKAAQSDPVVQSASRLSEVEAQLAKAKLENEARKRAEQERLIRAEQLRVEQEARRRAEEERLLQEERARVENEARLRAEHERLLAEERARAEEEARRRAELERKLTEERTRAEQERRRQADLAKRLKEEQERAYPASTLAKLDETTPPPSLAPMTLPQMSLHPSAFLAASNPTLEPEVTGMKDTIPEPPAVLSVPPEPSRLPMLAGLAGAAVVLVAVVGLAAYFLWSNANNANRGPEDSPPPPSTMVRLPGGSFMMGRDNVSNDFLNEFPAHPVEVNPFWIDRTEVTCREYAECIQSGICSRPPSWMSEALPTRKEQPIWPSDAPPPGQELWPITNVSVDDAQKFASWRSKRHGVEYRLPTEAEWEYAARSGNSENLYPWGKKWIDGYANIAAKTPAPVGSYSLGASTQGVNDLIGNVWEWTSSRCSIYPENGGKASCADHENSYVIRGAYYGSTVTGSEAATATRRTWLPETERRNYLGFRLARNDQ